MVFVGPIIHYHKHLFHLMAVSGNPYQTKYVALVIFSVFKVDGTLNRNLIILNFLRWEKEFAHKAKFN